MPLPNFLVIGAPKTGTTSLYEYLRQHPQIYMSPRKEPRFFPNENQTLTYKGPRAEAYNREATTRLDDYLALFNGVTNEIAIGEATPTYLADEKALPGIKRHIPNAKLIAILRDPSERAYSGFLHYFRTGRENDLDFGRALLKTEERQQAGWYYGDYLTPGLYHRHLSRYYAAFPAEQIKVFLYEDTIRDPGAMHREIFRFLGVAEDFKPDMTERHNTTVLYKSHTLGQVVNQTAHPVNRAVRLIAPQAIWRPAFKKAEAWNAYRPRLEPAIRRQLIEFFRADILGLQSMLKRDLSAWLT